MNPWDLEWCGVAVHFGDGAVGYVDVQVHRTPSAHGIELPTSTEVWTRLAPILRGAFSGRAPEEHPGTWGVYRRELVEAVEEALRDGDSPDILVEISAASQPGMLCHGPLEFEVDGLRAPLHIRRAKTQRDPDRLPRELPPELRAAELRCLGEVIKSSVAGLPAVAKKSSSRLVTFLQTAVNVKLSRIGRKLTTLEVAPFFWEELRTRTSHLGPDAKDEVEYFDYFARHLRREISVVVPFGVAEVRWSGWIEVGLGDAEAWEYRNPTEAHEGLEAELRVALRSALREVCWGDIELRPTRVESRMEGRLRDSLARRRYRLDYISGSLRAGGEPPARACIREHTSIDIGRRMIDVEIEVNARLVSVLNWRESGEKDFEETLRGVILERGRYVLGRVDLGRFLRSVEVDPRGESSLGALIQGELEATGNRLGYVLECSLKVVDEGLLTLIEGFTERLYLRLPSRWAEHEAEFVVHISGRCMVGEPQSALMRAVRDGASIGSWLHTELGRYFAGKVRRMEVGALYGTLDGEPSAELCRGASELLRRSGVSDARVETELSPHPLIKEFRDAWGGGVHEFDFEIGSRIHHHPYRFLASLQFRGLAKYELSRFFRVANVPSFGEVKKSVCHILEQELRGRGDGTFLTEDLDGGDFSPHLEQLQSAVQTHCAKVFGLDIMLTHLRRQSSIEEEVASGRRREPLIVAYDRMEARKRQRTARGDPKPGFELGETISDPTPKPRVSLTVPPPKGGYRSATPGCVFEPSVMLVVSHDDPCALEGLLEGAVQRCLARVLAGVSASAFWLAEGGAASVNECHAEVCREVELEIQGKVESVQVDSVRIRVCDRMESRIHSWLGRIKVRVPGLLMEKGWFKTEADVEVQVDRVLDDGWNLFSNAGCEHSGGAGARGGQDGLVQFVRDMTSVHFLDKGGEVLAAGRLAVEYTVQLREEAAERFGIDLSPVGIGYSPPARRKLMEILESEAGSDRADTEDGGKSGKRPTKMLREQERTDTLRRLGHGA